MDHRERKIKELEDKLINASSFQAIVYTEAIELMKNNVNVDKVLNWVTRTVYQFNDKPQPLSDKEKQRRKDKQRKRKEKLQKHDELNAEMKNLMESNGVHVMGFIEPKEMKYNDYLMMVKMLEGKGYVVTDNGDGVYTPCVSDRELDHDFFAKYEDLDEQIASLKLTSKERVIDQYLLWNTYKFKEKVLAL